MTEEKRTAHYGGSEGGWGSLRGIAEILVKEVDRPAVLDTLRRQNKSGGFMCVSCAYTTLAHPHAFEFCENGAKATIWDLTSRRCTPKFFAKHTVTELKEWDHDLNDFHLCDAIFFFGQNPGTNSPRLLHPLQECVKRWVKIVTFNPVREKGLESFKNPQSPVEMLTTKATQISHLYLQVKAGGDIAAIMGMIKHVLAAEEKKWTEQKHHVLDVDFIAQHTAGFEEIKAKAKATSWEQIERESDLARADIEEAADVYINAHRVIAICGMGLTQQVHGFQNLAMLVNLMLLKGNIGRDGTGMSPMRGHSNVQGQRTVGIAEKPELVPLDALAGQFGFEPPREEGMNTVKACEKLLSLEMKALIGLGGNFVRAVPEREKIEAAWTGLQPTVQIATKLMALNQVMAPNMMDRIMARFGIPGSKTDVPAPDAREGNLYAPVLSEDRASGDFAGQSRPSSLYTWLELHPMARLAAGGALVGAVALARNRRAARTRSPARNHRAAA